MPDNTRHPYSHTRERRSRLLDLINNGTTTVIELAQILDISESTVRRDLSYLRAKGKIERTYGGAVAASIFHEFTFTEARERATAAKSAIAELALEHLPEQGLIFLDAGTTCAELARHIAQKTTQPLTIVTRGLESAIEFLEVPHIETILLGGRIRKVSHAMVGPLTEHVLERMHFAISFLGANTVDVERGIGEPTFEEIRSKECAAHHSDKIVVLADCNKFGATPPAWLNLTPGWTLITNHGDKAVNMKNAHCNIQYATVKSNT